MTAFPTQYNEIRDRLESFDPSTYASTRNYKDGNVSRLSPYISRGVFSTGYVFRHFTIERGIHWTRIYKFVQELAWREYFQRVWQHLGQFDTDIRQPQPGVLHHKIPQALVHASTAIDAVDQAIKRLYHDGYLHNHMRMYIASVACNVAGSHWRLPAKWMYYYLLDADWASNALSWQWVAGAFSHKKYYANQENINRYFDSGQKGTFLDHSYDLLVNSPIPEVLKETAEPVFHTNLPPSREPFIDESLPILIYNFYNLDPLWHNENDYNRILLLEPSFFSRYPVSEKTIRFVLDLAGNIPGIQIFSGEFRQLRERYQQSEFRFMEHPENLHYHGEIEERDWIFPQVQGYYTSFSKFWKKAESTL